MSLEEEEEERVEVKFRLQDGSDIGPFKYSPGSTISLLKNTIFANWPKDNKVVPKSANDVKIIHAGRVLDNSKTVGQCRMSFGELEKGVITMLAVVQPSLAKIKPEKKIDESERKSFCSCSIL